MLGFGISARADVLDKAKDAVKEYVLNQNADWEGGNVVVTIKGADKFFEKFSADNNVKFKVPENYRLTKITSNLILPIVALSNGREAGKVTAIIKIEVYMDVVVANRQINKKENISDEDLDLKTREVSLYPPRYFISKDEITGKIASSSIQKGTILLEWMVKDQPVVSKGNQIKILARGENIAVETAGTALSDGQLNDLIFVRRDNGKEQFKAKVISADTVEVKL